MQELIYTIVTALVDHPDRVQIQEQEKEDYLLILLSVAPEDRGRVIGKQGRVAKAVRAVAGASAFKRGKRVRIEIV